MLIELSCNISKYERKDYPKHKGLSNSFDKGVTTFESLSRVSLHTYHTYNYRSQSFFFIKNELKAFWSNYDNHDHHLIDDVLKNINEKKKVIFFINFVYN